MTLCTLMLTYEVYEGSLGQVPLPMLSWSVYIHGLEEKPRRGMIKFFPELAETNLGGITPSLTFSQNDKSRNYLNVPVITAVVTKYLNFLDGEGFHVSGHTCDSSVYSGGVTKTIFYTLQAPSGPP